MNKKGLFKGIFYFILVIVLIYFLWKFGLLSKIIGMIKGWIK